MTPTYDEAWGKYISKLNILQIPLVCWEFYNAPHSDMASIESISKNWHEKKDAKKCSINEKHEIVITNSLFKIVFASSTIFNMNGYRSDEIIGKSPGFFQGKNTCNKTRARIKAALQNKLPFKETILNYKKNGEEYWCCIEAYPKFDISGNFLNYIAFEKLVA
jgi:PAS domain S-box-containing protein